ncbi:MAG: response regulator [Gemmatimonadetes bacterium]|nr:MAG: response regulator [Gemmatimonadota bacterium]
MQTSKYILIIDDERIFTFLLAEELSENPNYVVHTTHSGEDALKMMQHQTYDLLISDLKLPGISGLEFISVAKKVSPQTKVILMTAYNVHKMEQRIRDLGVDEYIYKPFSMSRLSELVVRVLDETDLELDDRTGASPAGIADSTDPVEMYASKTTP